MNRLILALVSVFLAGCVIHSPEASGRWLAQHQSLEHYQYSELAPEGRQLEVPEPVRADAVASLQRAPFRRLSEAEFRYYGGSTLERVPFQSAFLLRAVRPVNRRYRLEVYRDHVEHHGHKEPPATVSTVLRTGGLEERSLEKTAIIYVDSRPPERLNVDFLLSR